jgi:hypothetical protein
VGIHVRLEPALVVALEAERKRLDAARVRGARGVTLAEVVRAALWRALDGWTGV